MGRAPGWIGRKDRDDVAMDAIVHRIDGSSVPVKLTNLTDGGCRIEGGEVFQIGERVQIALPRIGHMDAQVRWALPGSAGAQFLGNSDF